MDRTEAMLLQGRSPPTDLHGAESDEPCRCRLRTAVVTEADNSSGRKSVGVREPEYGVSSTTSEHVIRVYGAAYARPVCALRCAV